MNFLRDYMSYGKKWKSRSKKVSPFGLKTWMEWPKVREIYWNYVIPKKFTMDERYKIWNHYFYYYDRNSKAGSKPWR